ncbi:hypothetical protein HOE04_02850 [archaeon]|jgi:hypothetical protein|nr:hypothetical protein [archaeon]
MKIVEEIYKDIESFDKGLIHLNYAEYCFQEPEFDSSESLDVPRKDLLSMLSNLSKDSRIMVKQQDPYSSHETSHPIYPNNDLTKIIFTGHNHNYHIPVDTLQTFIDSKENSLTLQDTYAR